jgi:(p)ppGpp synthase/HD superfamily hydrolase
VDDFFAAVGYGDINSQQIAQKILEYERREAEKLGPPHEIFRHRTNAQERTASEGLMVQGVEGLLTQLGRCCNPVPEDAIVGYVTKGRGVTIHRTSCPNIASVLRRNLTNRLIDVQWSIVRDAVYPVKIQINAYDRAGLVRDVASLVADEHINMSSVEAITGQRDSMALINATLEIADVSQLMRILTKIERLPNIVDVRRSVS